MSDPKPLRFRVTVSPNSAPTLYQKLAALPTDARPQELVALASHAGADPQVLSRLDRIASALEAAAAGGGFPSRAVEGPPPADGSTSLPAGLDNDEWG